MRDMIEWVDGRWLIEYRKVGMSSGSPRTSTPAFDHEETRIGRRLAQL